MALLLIVVAAASMSVAPRSTALAQSSGICDRTQEVRDAILTKLSDVSDCANVTDSHLAGITGDLTLSDMRASLRSRPETSRGCPAWSSSTSTPTT